MILFPFFHGLPRWKLCFRRYRVQVNPEWNIPPYYYDREPGTGEEISISFAAELGNLSDSQLDSVIGQVKYNSVPIIPQKQNSIFTIPKTMKKIKPKIKANTVQVDHRNIVGIDIGKRKHAATAVTPKGGVIASLKMFENHKAGIDLLERQVASD